MYFKNFEPQPKRDRGYAGLRKDAKFLFPNIVKYVVWLFVAVIVISSSMVVAYYGVAFGLAKTYFWLVDQILAVCASLLITTPLRIYLYSLIKVVCNKKKPSVIKRRVHKYLLENPENGHKKQHVLQHRECNASLYAPTPLQKLEGRLEDIKYNIELRNFSVDMAAYIVFVGTFAYIMHINRSELTYHSTEIIRKLLVKANYTQSIPFTKVTTYETFFKYLNETFLPALQPDSTGNESLGRGKRWPQEVRRLEAAGGESNGSVDVFSRGLTLNPELKMMGKPRLRQVRVKAESCREFASVKTRSLECAGELTAFNVERGVFSLRWEPGPPKGLTPRQAAPWAYQSAWRSQSLPTFGKFSVYPGGGYILELARDLKASRTILEFAESFKWVDIRTRAVFLEFTVYCVNTNLFNVVSLIAEKTASGYIIPSYQIHTSKFIFTPVGLEAIFVLKSFLFFCFLLFILVRESISVYRTSIASYLKRILGLLCLATIVLGLLGLIFILCRNYYTLRLLKKLEQADYNVFVSFMYASAWDSWCSTIEATMVSLSSFKLFQLLTCRMVFFQFRAVLTFCYQLLLNLSVAILVLILAFAFFFNIAIGSSSYEFRSFGASVVTVILRSVAVDDCLESNPLASSASYLVPLVFFLFFVFVTLLFFNVFVAAACFYLHEVQKVSLANRYGSREILGYLKHSMTKQEDIVHLKEAKRGREDRAGPSVMRLRGGGSRSSAQKKARRRCGEAEKRVRRREGEDESVRKKVNPRDLVSRKLYDTTAYQDLAADRDMAMKQLTLSVLSEGQGAAERARQRALMALFCSFTAAKQNRISSRTSQGPYYFAADECSTEVYDSRRFEEMKKVVEDAVRCRGWLEEDDSAAAEVASAENRLCVLSKKLCLLTRKLNLK